VRALLLGALALVSAATLPPLRAEDQVLTFSDHGKAVKSLTLSELKGLVPSRTVRVFEPHEVVEASFQALPLGDVLTKIYGPSWQNAEQAFFICDDGYRAPVALGELQKNPGWLAFSRVGSKDFAITEKEPVVRRIEVGPLFLVRGGEGHLAARSKVKEGWPYKVVGVDLISITSQYPGLTPPAKASAAVNRGYRAFSRHCVSCHALGGEGGRVGPELAVPVSVTVYYKERWLKKWIINPSAIRAGTTMPATVPEGPEQARTVDDIVAYLKVIAAVKAAKP
jgi:cytochrome c2